MLDGQPFFPFASVRGHLRVRLVRNPAPAAVLVLGFPAVILNLDYRVGQSRGRRGRTK